MERASFGIAAYMLMIYTNAAFGSDINRCIPQRYYLSFPVIHAIAIAIAIIVVITIALHLLLMGLQ